MERRNFIKSTAVMCGGAMVGPGCLSMKIPMNQNNGVLKGFIVSDSHFGWDPDPRHFKPGVQPRPELQAEMMQRIVRQFPDLDVFLDTGDAHHSGLKGIKGDTARGDWTDIIAGGCAISPFYYVPGNHELAPLNDDGEWRCDSLGSIACRPYYSFDLKGIHFVSLPELEKATLVNKESIEWLKLDLEINKDRSTILLSHNNIKGTTTPFGESGYRGIINTDELLSIMTRYPNIIAWMHGHNHTYEVLRKYNKLFVSNGRIGGFIPPPAWGRVGQGHLGGIYFEVRPDKLVVRSYSATAGKFLDELGETHLSGELKRRTTLDTHASPAYSYGVGGMFDGQRIPVFNHHTDAGRQSELFVSGTDTSVMNDDPELLNYGAYTAGSLGTNWYIAGCSIGHGGGFIKENKTWEWLDPGVRLRPQEVPGQTVDVCIPDFGQGKCHYRCSPGHTYKATLDIDSPQGGQRVQLRIIFQNKEGDELASPAAIERVIKPGLHTYEVEAQMPAEAAQGTIYADPASDHLIQVMAKATFSQLDNELTLLKYELRSADTRQGTVDPAMIVDGKRYAHVGLLGCDKPVRFELATPASGRSVYECKADGNRRVTWLVRQQSLDWQVRNAPVADKGNYLEIGPLRNTWTHRKEVVIAPMRPMNEPYVHRLQNTKRVRIYPLGRNNSVLKIEVLECGDDAGITVYCQKAPAQVLGAKDWKYNAPDLSINVGAGTRIRVI